MARRFAGAVFRVLRNFRDGIRRMITVNGPDRNSFAFDYIPGTNYPQLSILSVYDSGRHEDSLLPRAENVQGQPKSNENRIKLYILDDCTMAIKYTTCT